MVQDNQSLEDEVELLRQQLTALTGSSQEIGVLVALGHGMTQRLAQILHILVKRSPASLSRSALHTVFYGDREDGGPDTRIFAVHMNRTRAVLRRLNAPGKIETNWNSGYRATPELCDWVRQLYKQQIKEK